eukprot:TRINITY_DN2696_c0_g1_i1.p1 TRINITY_DN2696_c0_g1~~TRINITY_DN2696_c0_g1_i1.p1  ORF type:complete len:163 (+),score=51.26 TRINITY_DN2696_c0_g1_i1:421-909(+)
MKAPVQAIESARHPTRNANANSTVQERTWQVEAQGTELGEALMYFGCEHPDRDYLYRSELEHAVAIGALTQLRPTFAQAPGENGAVFVQHAMASDARVLYELILSGAVFYVCGKGTTVGAGVRQALECAFREGGGSLYDKDSAYDAVKKLYASGRMQQDVFA